MFTAKSMRLRQASCTATRCSARLPMTGMAMSPMDTGEMFREWAAGSRLPTPTPAMSSTVMAMARDHGAASSGG